jgi:DNA-binding winged helix-turn-helix (wHTH) protein
MDEQSVIYRFGWFELDPGRRSLRSIENGEPVALTAKLFDTLLYLIKHRGQLVGKQALLEAVWPNVIVEEANLKQTISGLRRALQEDPQAREYIATIPGRGYQFVAEVNSVSSITRQARPKAKLSFLIIGLLVAALAFVLIDQYRIRAGTEPVERVAEQVAPPQGEVVSIAVLPFVNMIGDPEQEYFSDGISEELLNVLAKIPGLRVPSRTSSFSFKGQNMDLPTIAAALNVSLDSNLRTAVDQRIRYSR